VSARKTFRSMVQMAILNHRADVKLEHSLFV
jgi:hypothetical protein